MAHQHDPNEKVVFVGDSRVRKVDRSNTHPVDYSAYPGKSEAFIPNFLLKEWMVGVVAVTGFLMLVLSEPAPLGYPADPLNGSFIPMPDWYFLFLYQLLKYPYTSGDFVAFGVVAMSGLPFIALLLAPFLDRGKDRRWFKRPIASALMGLSLVSIFYLTIVSWNHYQHELEVNSIVPEHIEREIKAKEAVDKGLPRPIPGKDKLPAMVAADDPAFSTMQEAQCLQCHGTELEGALGPALRGIGDQLSKEELAQIITNGKGDGMPPFEGVLTAEQIDQVATWLALQKAEASE